jgi:hypothetical protein
LWCFSNWKQPITVTILCLWRSDLAVVTHYQYLPITGFEICHQRGGGL